MIISYHGGECFKIVFGDTTLAINPISKESKLKAVRFGADIVLISLIHPDFDGVEQVISGKQKPFVIYGPGEYEVRKVVVRGFPAISEYGGEERIDTVYLVKLEGMNLCFLGPLATPKLSSLVRGSLDNIDILFVPVGGDGVLDAKAAHELAVDLSPNIIIPMHYGEIGKENALATFLKEEGAENTKALEKLTIKRKDLEGKEGDIVVLAS